MRNGAPLDLGAPVAAPPLAAGALVSGGARALGLVVATAAGEVVGLALPRTGFHPLRPGIGGGGPPAMAAAVVSLPGARWEVTGDARWWERTGERATVAVRSLDPRLEARPSIARRLVAHL